MNLDPSDSKRLETDINDLFSHVGHEIGVSSWLRIDQDRIGAFADCTDDRQWIHIDPEKASAESPFKSTIAHGFLTLSLLPHFVNACLHIQDAKIGINYGLNRVRFPHPVATGSQIRARIQLQSCESIKGGIQYLLKVTIEIQGESKPACVAEAIFRALH